MGPLAIIIHHNIFKDHSRRLVTRGEAHTMNELYLDRVKETLSDGIVPAITFSAHATDKFIPSQYRLKIIAGILATTVGMKNQSLAWTAL